MSDKVTCTLDYESEYYRLQEILNKLTEENNELKRALLNLALKI